MKIPVTGTPAESLLDTLESFKARDLDWKSGRVFGYTYAPAQAAMDTAKKAFLSYLTENGLDFTSFPSLLRLETELIAMAAAHLGGDEQVVGNFSSGGTESIIMAVKAARDGFRQSRPEIRAPEMILPSTAHAAFHKAAHYLGLKVVATAVNPGDFRAEVEAVRRAITANTILIVGSAPSYAHGVVDPIPELAAVARDHGLLCHVDACVGGFLLPYFRRLGVVFPDFDFGVPGVTSISMDLHKYAYAPKGASVVLYRNRALRRHQVFACAQWTGYAIVNTAVQSSKSGGPLAGAWATLNFIGDAGYLEIARRSLEATRRLSAGIEAIDGLRLMTRPDFCMFSFTSERVSIFRLIDEMNARGWYIQPQLAFGGSKENAHLSVTTANVGWVEEFLADLAECVDSAGRQPPGNLAEAVAAGLAQRDIAALTDADIIGLMESVGMGAGGALPARMADINEIMNALPPALRERLLAVYVNQVFGQAP
jgi:glutamate/tyrosine decarboxylase-like PLP-dependent enzyme